MNGPFAKQKPNHKTASATFINHLKIFLKQMVRIAKLSLL